MPPLLIVCAPRRLVIRAVACSSRYRLVLFFWLSETNADGNRNERAVRASGLAVENDVESRFDESREPSERNRDSCSAVDAALCLRWTAVAPHVIDPASTDQVR